VMGALAPGNASKQRVNALSAVAENATWRDVGAAVGALVGGILLSSNYLTEFLCVGVILLFGLFLVEVFKGVSGRKIFYTWK
jgi:predicted MFS family arabinose efflux permease